MKWRNLRQSTNVEDRTGETPPNIPEGTVLVDGSIYTKGNKRVTKNVEFNPNDSKEMEVVKDLGRRNMEGKNPTPTPRPSSFKSHDNLVTPGKWKTK